MHHHDKLEDTWHAANIRWHTHSHVSRVRSLNEQALQCVCGTGKTPTCHSNWWVCGPPAGCPSRVHNARTASTPEPCLDRVASPASTWATAAPSDTEPLACPISSSRKVGVNLVRAVAMSTFSTTLHSLAMSKSGSGLSALSCQPCFSRASYTRAKWNDSVFVSSTSLMNLSKKGIPSANVKFSQATAAGKYLAMNVAAYCIGVLNHLDCWKALFRAKFNKRRKDLFC